MVEPSRTQAALSSKQQILEAALQLSVERGYAGTTMASVSAESGLPIGSVYWHFKNKEQLFVELLEHCFEVWQEVHQGDVGSLGDLVEAQVLSAVGAPVARVTVEERFLKLSLLLSLDSRLGGLGADSEVRQTYVRLRRRMYELSLRRLSATLPAHDPGSREAIVQELTVLCLAIADGFFLQVSSGINIDAQGCAQSARRAVEAMARERLASSDAA